MLVRHFMTCDVFTLSPDQRCQEALDELRQHHVRRAPVLSQNKILGMVTERDLLRVLPKTLAQISTEEGEAAMDIPVWRVMTTEVETLHPNDHLEFAARLMLNRKIGSVPVVEGDALKGIITESDIFKALWGILSTGVGCRILFEELDDREDLSRCLELCQRHRCRVTALLRHPSPKGGTMYYLCVVDGEVDALVDDLWSKSSRVISVERNTLQDDRSTS